MRLILFLGIVVNMIFAGELAITKKFTSSKEVEPRFLFVNIYIESSSMLRNIGELKNNDREKIINTLNHIINEAENTNICKGGSFSITPIINYDKDNRKTIGQNVNFNLNCKFTKGGDLDTYNNLLSMINNAIAQNKLLYLPQPSISYRLTDDEIESTKEELFDEFLSTISQIESKYSKILDKKCYTKNINYGENLRVSPIALNAKAQDSVMLSPSIAPIVDKTRISIEITTQLNCK